MESPAEREKKGIPFPAYAKLSRTRTQWVAKQFGLGLLPEHVGKPRRVPMSLWSWAKENHVHYYQAREWWREGRLDRWGITNRKLPWWEDSVEWEKALVKYERAMVGINREIVRLEELWGRIKGARIGDIVWRYKRLYTNHVQMMVRLRIARQQVEAVQRARLEGRETWSGAEALRRAAVEERVSMRKQLRGLHGMRNAWREKVKGEQVAKIVAREESNDTGAEGGDKPAAG